MYTKVIGRNSCFISEKKFGLIEMMVQEILSKRKTNMIHEIKSDLILLNI